ncbi:MAG TPA: MarR family winged helix-turn-helix transcriptional regulator [Acidimicrobiales bacterium]
MQLSDQAADAFLAASRALVGVSARSLADVEDVTLPQYRALVVIASRDGVTVRQLAERLDIHPSTATRLCDRLVRKSLIRRAERDADRRETEIVLAAKGRRLVDRVTERRRHALVAIALQMSADQLRHAVLGLRAFAEVAGETPEATLFGWPEPAGDAGAQPTGDDGGPGPP